MRNVGQCWRGPSWSDDWSPCGRRWRCTGQWPHYWTRATPTWIGPLYRSATPRSPYSGWQTPEGWEAWKGLWGNTQGYQHMMSYTIYPVNFSCHKINEFCCKCVIFLFASFFCGLNSFLQQRIPDIISAYWFFCDEKIVIVKKAKIRTSQKLPDIRYDKKNEQKTFCMHVINNITHLHIYIFISIKHFI